MKDFKKITFEVIDISVNASPDIFINRNGITFSRKVLDDLNYPANVQYSISAEEKVFAIRPCKSNEAKCATFSKPKSEQNATLSCGNKNLIDSVRSIMPEGYDKSQRYKVTGFYDAESKIMYFDMAEAKIDIYRTPKEEN